MSLIHFAIFQFACLLRFVLVQFGEKITDLLTSVSISLSPSLSLSFFRSLSLWQRPGKCRPGPRRNPKGTWGYGGLTLKKLPRQERGKRCKKEGRMGKGEGGLQYMHATLTSTSLSALSLLCAVLKIFQVARSFGRSRWPPVFAVWSRLG